MTTDNQPNNKSGIINEITCKNCHTPFNGQYCPNCGQHIRELERPIRFMVVDFMGTFVSFDTRLAKTLMAILFKPGKLTQDFLDGKRARYMPPFRFYVFASFVMFLLISTLTGNSIKEGMKDIDKELSLGESAALTDSINHITDSVFLAVDEELKAELDSAQYHTYKQITDSNTVSIGIDNMVTGIKELDKLTEEDDSKYSETIKLIKEHPELYVNKVFQYTSWALFLFMPIFAFFLWLSFLRSKPLYIGHLIFSLNIHSFIFTIASIVVGAAVFFPNFKTGWLGYLFLLVPVYQVIGARKLYKRRWISTFFKLTLVWWMYGFVWLVGLIVLAVTSFVGM